MAIWLKIVIVGITGGFGAICRLLVEQLMPTSGPWLGLNTWVINTLGCLLIGIFAGLLVVAPWNETWKTTFALATMTGFCGGFSTFSSFTLDCVKYFEAGHFGIWLIFGAMTVFCGLFFCALGYWLGTKIW